MARAGYFPVEELLTFRSFGTRLQGHPSTIHFPEIEISSGSLGQGLSQGVGLALAGKLDKSNFTVFVCMSDGECQEGMTWEAAMSAAHWKLDNLVAFIDRNFIQIDGETETIMAMEPLHKKFESFGWHVIEADGHCFEEILNAFHRAKAETGRPTVIIFRTIIGRGVSFMEDTNVYHGKPPTPELAEKAIRELEDWREVIQREEISKTI
jgi:transketolase